MITVYTKNNCPKCDMTKSILEGEGVEFKVINIEENEEALEYVRGLGFSSAPIVEKEGREPFSGFQPDKLKGFMS